jgi:hypothetical protein
MPTHPASMNPTARTSALRGLLRPLMTAFLVVGAGVACSLFGGSRASGPSAGSGPGGLNDPTAGLEGLAAYRATLVLEFDGTRDGAPLAWSQTLTLESDRAASARLLTMDRHGPDPSQDAEGILIGQFGEMSLTRPDADAACQAEVGDDALTIPEPASLLRPFQAVSLSDQPEDHNGVSARHATLDAEAIGASSQAEVDGEVWVAAEGDFIVGYALEIDGTADDLGEGLEGVMRWEYDLEPLGQDGGLLPPPGCPLGMVEAPLPDDAAQIVSQPGILSLTTGLDVTAAAEFYREQLASQGWTAGQSDYLTPRAALLTFTQPDRQLTVRIEPGPPTQIWITLARPSTATPGAAPQP